jgi:hypothetical protein
MRTISIRLDDHTDSLLKAHCQRHGLTQTDAIKAAIEQMATRQRRTPAELAAELGLIGGFHSGVPDLARNRARYIKERLIAKRTRDSVPTAKPARTAVKAAPTVKPRRGSVTI